MDHPPSFLGTHLVDIHEVLPEEEEEENMTTNEQNKLEKVSQRRHNRTTSGFSRQVSLETGFSVLNGESSSSSKRKEGEERVLSRSRSGKSLGAFTSVRERGGAGGVVGEGRKGDFSRFRTKSTLSRQNSSALAKRDNGIMMRMDSSKKNEVDDSINKSVPAGRYFAALRGPELDQVKDSEDILLPKDEIWPFLLRFPIGCFGMCLGLSSQAILWLNLSTSESTKFLHISPWINFFLWILALAVLVVISITYALKCAFYFEAVRREYFHPVRVNFFFAPWVVCMFLAIGVPSRIAPGTLNPIIWCVFMAPILFLDLKIYGQWLSGGKRRLCQVANPSSHLSVVGNFVGAILAAKVEWDEAGKFFWAVGFAHYLVVFVTLYQRLPTSEALPKELHPVYSMFIATPAAASIAWGALYGEFDGLSRTCYFIALFLFMSLVVRVNFFRGFKFSVAWWSYTFPMTTVSIATIKYADEAPSVISKGLALVLSFMSSTMVSLLFISTLLHAFVWKTLFPNDLAIAITKKRQGKEKKPLKQQKSPLSFVSTIRRQNSSKKGSNSEN